MEGTQGPGQGQEVMRGKLHPLPTSPRPTRNRILAPGVSNYLAQSRFLRSNKQHNQEPLFEIQAKALGLHRRTWTEARRSAWEGSVKPAMSLARVGPGLEGFSEEEVMVEACPPAPGESHGCLFTSYCRSGRECSSDSFSLRRQASLQAGGRAADRFCFPRWG